MNNKSSNFYIFYIWMKYRLKIFRVLEKAQKGTLFLKEGQIFYFFHMSNFVPCLGILALAE